MFLISGMFYVTTGKNDGITGKYDLNKNSLPYSFNNINGNYHLLAKTDHSLRKLSILKIIWR